MWQHVKLSDVSLGARPLYSLVVDEDVKKTNKQTNKQAIDVWKNCFDHSDFVSGDIVLFSFFMKVKFWGGGGGGGYRASSEN